MNIFSLRLRFSARAKVVCSCAIHGAFLVHILLLILVSLSFSANVFAVESPAEHNTSKSGNPPELSTYKLQVGDSIVVTVEGYPEYTKDRIAVPVQPDGYISYPLIGLIKATDLTVSELEAQMQAAFSQHLPSARVFVTLMQPKRNILVFGAVEPRARGNLQVFSAGHVYLMHALAASGINYELADLTKIAVWRDGKRYQEVNFLELLKTGKGDILLKDYDIVIVPSVYAQRRIRVIGAVTAPGLYPIPLATQQIEAIQALKLAGGSRADFADLKRAEIITNTERTLVDLTLENVNAMLAPGNTLYIPLAEAKISVTGAVDKPGQYVITEPTLLGQAIAMAGGFNEEKANPKKCLLTRADGTQEELNFDQAQSMIYLNPNDQLRIPERMRIDWRVLNFAASFTNLIVTVWLRYR